jgi:hypothetical protein
LSCSFNAANSIKANGSSSSNRIKQQMLDDIGQDGSMPSGRKPFIRPTFGNMAFWLTGIWNLAFWLTNFG